MTFIASIKLAAIQATYNTATGRQGCVVGRVLFLASRDAARRTPFGVSIGSVSAQATRVATMTNTA